MSQPLRRPGMAGKEAVQRTTKPRRLGPARPGRDPMSKATGIEPFSVRSHPHRTMDDGGRRAELALSP